jgi:hypothetical protein
MALTESGNYTQETPHPSAPETTSGSTVWQGTNYANAAQLIIQLNVTAVSGTTPNMAFVIEDSVDGGANWNQVIAFTAVTAPGLQLLRVISTTPFSPMLRSRRTITGTTPSFTYQLDVVAKR